MSGEPQDLEVHQRAAAADHGLVLDVRGLRCRYGRFVAVDGIDLEVRRGEVMALLGTNGAGKTTTLETIEGHRRPDEGSVHVLGMDPRRQRRAVARRIGVVFQRDGLPEGLTPAETVDLWRRLRQASGPDPGSSGGSGSSSGSSGSGGSGSGGSASDGSGSDGSGSGGSGTHAVLERVGLAHRSRIPTSQLSGGERRRLDLALALSTTPELLVLDEPTSGMDPESRQRTWQLIRELAAEGRTVLLTTHHLDEAESLADRITIMHQGRIAARGTLPELVATLAGTIRFRHRPDVDPDLLPALSGDVAVTDAGGPATVVVRTESLQADLSRLLRWADERDVALDDLQAGAASLAEVFFGVAGDAGGD